MSACPKCHNERVPIEWCKLCSLGEHPDYIRLKADNMRLQEALRPWAALEKEVRYAKGAALSRQKDEWELGPYLWALWEGGCVRWWPVKIGDLRRAHAVLKGETHEQG